LWETPGRQGRPCREYQGVRGDQGYQGVKRDQGYQAVNGVRKMRGSYADKGD